MEILSSIGILGFAKVFSEWQEPRQGLKVAVERAAKLGVSFGFDVGEVLGSYQALSGYGLYGMRERVEIYKGEFALNLRLEKEPRSLCPSQWISAKELQNTA